MFANRSCIRHIARLSCRRHSTAQQAKNEGSWTATEVRQTFIEFFEKRKGHVNYPSSSVVLKNDPSILFVNAGMNQFKGIFQGNSEISEEFTKLRRVVNTQKCIRAGGKHNDLDAVGVDVYHHTFFEMLGNWSFGDYFKEEICAWAWELLTEIYRIDKDKLYITYFGGDSILDIPPDHQCRDIWLKIGVPSERILPFSLTDNFWEMGEVGPCGPCSEIHYDRIGGRNAAHLVNRGDPDVLEIWNLVFIQHDRMADGSLSALPRRHIDCGMGLERLVSILQNKCSNYDTDLFAPIFQAIHTQSQFRTSPFHAYAGRVGSADANGLDTAYRIIADHIRSLCIAIGDGVLPANRDHGYVLRRLLRKSIWLGSEKFKVWPSNPVQVEPFLSTLYPAVCETLGNTFPELVSNGHNIIKVLNTEENKFLKVLKSARSRVTNALLALPSKSKILPGDVLFELHSTHGIPVDLTQMIAVKHGLEADIDGYKAYVLEQRRRTQEALRQFRVSGTAT